MVPWKHHVEDVSALPIAEVRFLFEHATDYRGDIALDNIKLISV